MKLTNSFYCSLHYFIMVTQVTYWFKLFLHSLHVAVSLLSVCCHWCYVWEEKKGLLFLVSNERQSVCSSCITPFFFSREWAIIVAFVDKSSGAHFFSLFLCSWNVCERSCWVAVIKSNLLQSIFMLCFLQRFDTH